MFQKIKRVMNTRVYVSVGGKSRPLRLSRMTFSTPSRENFTYFVLDCNRFSMFVS